MQRRKNSGQTQLKTSPHRTTFINMVSLIKKLLKPYVDEVKEDKLGNVIGTRKGEKNAPKVMLAAHMDEIGLLVKTITKEGFLHFAKMGVKVGDTICFDVKFAKIKENIVIGKAFDDRIGCVIMIEALKRLKKTECTIYAVGTVQEEVGLRGAATSAFGIYPDFGIALDVTISGDTPEMKETDAPVKMQKGPSLTVADGGMIVPTKVLRLMIDAAEENKIPP